jgi:hypothetical protein
MSAMLAAADRAGIYAQGLERAADGRDYLLGRNPWGASFFVGPGAREAKVPHHSVHLYGAPEVLANGMLVGGPARISDSANAPGVGTPAPGGPYTTFDPTYNDIFYNEEIAYEDRRANYVTSEVSLGYSAPAMLLFAITG